VDPDNRVVARTLEHEWEIKLREPEEVERQYTEARRTRRVDLSEEDRARVRELARDLPAVWRSPVTPPADRKAMMRLMIEAISLSPIEVPRRAERWIDSDAFFQTTHRIWLPLFFDGEGDGRGWLQRRYEAAVDQDDFVSAIRSPGLVAALVAWAVAVQCDLPTAAHSRFALASALAIARLPWLWDGLDDESVCRELAELLAYTTPSSASGVTEGVDAVGVAWLQLLRRGHALRRLELSLVGWTPARLAPHIRQSHLAKGEVLWQGASDLPTPNVAALYGVVGDYIETMLRRLSAQRINETRDGVLDNYREELKTLQPLAVVEVTEFVEQMAVLHPMASLETLSVGVRAYINLEKSRSGQALLEKLAHLSEDDVEGLNRLLSEWTVRDALGVLDEIGRRLTTIEAIKILSRTTGVDELHVLHPALSSTRRSTLPTCPCRTAHDSRAVLESARGEGPRGG
jgi:hypothetical protein